MDIIGQRLSATLQPLDLRWQYRATLAMGIGTASGNVWSRAARRKHQKTANGKPIGMDEDNDDDEEDEPALAFTIKLRPSTNDTIEVQVRWLQGADSVLFESFCGMIKRSLSG